MKIAHLIRKDFITVNPYSGINAIKMQLLKHSAIVVEDEEKFYGVLTEKDIVHNPRTLIIDCLTIKELIDCELSVEETILKMNTAETDVLPVGEKGNFIGLVFRNALYKYISEYNLELENIIKERTQELEKALATRDLMFSIIAHDLKSPFNAILGFTNLLKNKLRNFDIEKSEKLISSMNSQARRTYNLLEDLLSWASNKTGRIGFNPGFCDISKICEEVIAQIKDLAQIKNITLTTFHPTNSYAYADKNMVESILRNLITNAIKFTETNGKIEVYSILDEENVEVTVSDNGIGVPNEDKVNLFSLDLNKIKIGTANEKGTGFGLIICKDFVERHNGKIWLEDKSDKGSMFKFTLPVYKEEKIKTPFISDN